MGFASKLSTDFFSAGEEGATVLASPDTQFGIGVLPEPAAAAPAPAAGQFGRRCRPAPRPPGRQQAPRRRAQGRQGRGSDDEDLRLPLIGHLSLPRQLRILLIAFSAGILLTLLSLWRHSTDGAVAGNQTQIASDALMHSQRVGKAAPNAMKGIPDAFDQLQDSRIALDRDLALLSSGGDADGYAIPAASGSAASELAKVRKMWAVSNSAAASILKMKPELTRFEHDLHQLDALSPEMLALTEQILTERTARGGSPRELAALGRLMMLTQRLSRGASEFLTSGGIQPETAFQMGRDTTTFRVTVEGLLNGNPQLGLAALREPDLRAQLDEVRAKFDDLPEGDRFLPEQPVRPDRRQGRRADHLPRQRGAAPPAVGPAARLPRRRRRQRLWFWVLVASAVFTLAMAGSISRVMLQDSRNRTRGADARRQEAEAMRLLAQAKEEEAKATNDQNQAAILRLMNELQEVADGDLTVHATVSEDITGAIADSVNYTVEELRGLVVRVIGTAEQVRAASDDAQQVSSSLLAAAGEQSREIQDASSTVLRLAGEITDVSQSANESAIVARQSVAAASRARPRCRTRSRAWARSASRSRKPPSASSAWANRRRRSARSRN